ncbi:hypothetical protein TNCV_2270501 [Trichonephila clavipes]|nr:hypothetical protein TNCV_2270501 [Trichonephila clavipes]
MNSDSDAETGNETLIKRIAFSNSLHCLETVKTYLMHSDVNDAIFSSLHKVEIELRNQKGSQSSVREKKLFQSFAEAPLPKTNIDSVKHISSSHGQCRFKLVSGIGRRSTVPLALADRRKALGSCYVQLIWVLLGSGPLGTGPKRPMDKSAQAMALYFNSETGENVLLESEI